LSFAGTMVWLSTIAINPLLLAVLRKPFRLVRGRF
jgi:hypothetical protein